MDETSDLDMKSAPLPGVPDGAVLRLSGKGGRGAVQKLQETVQRLLAEGTKNLLFDCGGLEFFDSTSFGFLTNLSDSLREAGGIVALCRVPMNVQVAFEYMGLKEFFEFFGDESEAARFIRKRAGPEGATRPEVQDPLAWAEAKSGTEPPPSSSVGIALPAWLEDVDKPEPPPLDHLRWSALLQTVLRRLG